MPINDLWSIIRLLSLTILALVLSLAFIWAVKHYIQYVRIKRSWIVGEAKVANLAIGFHEEVDEGVLYYVYPKITYQYYYQGKAYISEQVTLSIHDMKESRPIFSDLINKYEPLRVWWNELKIGDTIKVKFDPNNPNNAIVVFKGNLARRWHYLMLIALLIILLTFTIGLIFVYL